MPAVADAMPHFRVPVKNILPGFFGTVAPSPGPAATNAAPDCLPTPPDLRAQDILSRSGCQVSGDSCRLPGRGGGWGVEKERKRSLPEIQLTAGHVFSEKWAGRGETSAAKNKQSAYLERLRRCKDASGRFGPTDLPLGLAACLICGVSHGPSTFGQSSVAPFLFSLPHRLPAGLGPPPPPQPPCFACS